MSLINREDLIEHLNHCLAETDESRPYIMDAVVIAVRCAVEQMPEVDAVPVVHAQWVVLDPTSAMCSHCRDVRITRGADMTGHAVLHRYFYPHCPRCGALMDLEDVSNGQE